MPQPINRRHFLYGTGAAGAMLGLGDLSFLSRLPAVSAAEAKLETNLVRLDSDIEPTVRLLEETPRERLLEEVAAEESKAPPAHKARQAFVDAMDNWDEPAADAAVAGLARTASAGEVFELLWRHGARDWRSIGHKAIFVSNSWRALQSIGWQHA